MIGNNSGLQTLDAGNKPPPKPAHGTAAGHEHFLTGRSSLLANTAHRRYPLTSSRDNGLADGLRRSNRQEQRWHAEVALQDGCNDRLVGLCFAQELRRAVTAGTDALPAVDVRLQRLVPEHLVKHRGGQLRRADLARVFVEVRLQAAFAGSACG